MKRCSQIFGVLLLQAFLLINGLSVSFAASDRNKDADTESGRETSTPINIAEAYPVADGTLRNELSTTPRSGKLAPGKPVFNMSGISNDVIEAFKKAWRISKAGTSVNEGVVLVFQNPDGSYTGESQGATNQYKEFTFTWNPKAIAIVHTHPNSSDPRPQEEDLRIADRFRVPMITITSRGMYMYDPRTKRTTKVLEGVEWLDFPRAYERLARR
jgi:hypothetical protein